MRFLKAKTVWVMLAAFMIISACRGMQPTAGAPPPDEARLRERLVAFHNALGANDIEAQYKMLSPDVRHRMSFDQFKKDMRWDENAVRRIPQRMHAQLERVCSCAPHRLLRCVLVVDVMIERPGQSPKQEKPLEMWEYEAGEWYYGIIGHDSRGRCPGEK